MYNFIIPCSLTHILVPKYCYVGISLVGAGSIYGRFMSMYWLVNSFINLSLYYLYIINYYNLCTILILLAVLQCGNK